jgi:hypothetical protein
MSTVSFIDWAEEAYHATSCLRRRDRAGIDEDFGEGIWLKRGRWGRYCCLPSLKAWTGIDRALSETQLNSARRNLRGKQLRHRLIDTSLPSLPLPPHSCFSGSLTPLRHTRTLPPHCPPNPHRRTTTLYHVPFSPCKRREGPQGYSGAPRQVEPLGAPSHRRDARTGGTSVPCGPPPLRPLRLGRTPSQVLPPEQGSRCERCVRSRERRVVARCEPAVRFFLSVLFSCRRTLTFYLAVLTSLLSCTLRWTSTPTVSCTRTGLRCAFPFISIFRLLLSFDDADSPFSQNLIDSDEYPVRTLLCILSHSELIQFR